MSVEASVFSPEDALDDAGLRTALASEQIAIRLLNGEGEPLAAAPNGPLRGRFIVIGWPVGDADTTAAVDAAIAATNKSVIDQLGQNGKFGWCEFGIMPFRYEGQWEEWPDDDEDFEESVEPELLAALEAARTQYSLRSGLRPEKCADLVDQMTRALKRATKGVCA